MDPTTSEGKPNRLLCLLLVAGVILSGLLLAACGSSGSSGTTSEETASAGAQTSTTSEGGETSAGDDQETTVYAKGIPTLKELYESSNEEPPSTGPTAVEGKEVAVIVCSTESVGCAYPGDSFVEAAEKLGWKAKIYDGKLNAENGYATAFHAALATNPDAITMFGVACEEVVSSLEEVKAAGIPIAEAATLDCSEEGGPRLFEIGQKFNKAALTTTEIYEAFGESQAAYVIDKTEGKAKVILTEWLGAAGRKVGTGWKKAFEKCSECEILENIEWEAAELKPNGPLDQRFKTALTKYPEANAAILAYDSVATFAGLAKAVVDSGRQNDMLIVAGEGFNESLQLLREGKGINAEGAAFDKKWVGWGTADEINRYFAGQPAVPEGTGVGVIDLDHNMPPEGQNYEAEGDYTKAYEEVWAGKKDK